MKNFRRKAVLFCSVVITCFSTVACAQTATTNTIKLPQGFSIKVAADNIGKARHIAVTKNGDLYVKLARPIDGKGIIFLEDKSHKGTFTQTAGFGNYGGTGIYLKNGYLYASSNSEVFRYKVDENDRVIDPAKPEKIVTGLIDRRQHETKSLVLDNNGNIYVNIGAYSNSCQLNDRMAGSPGMPDCPILEKAGGIWQFKIDQLDQSYHNGIRYATGLRNVVGLDWNQQDNSLYVMQHGRDQLTMFPDLYTSKQSADLPSECMYKLKQGDNCGWPYMYYDHIQKKKIVAPEYGGDGKKEADNKYIDPVVAFPAHLAPNGLLFYTGKQFPDRYKNGAFVAFHGSWNRSPEPQAGYFVAFVPFKDGKPAGPWEIFADGFAGVKTVTSTGQAQHRPCGLAQAPDGSIYVTDDVKGTIYKISYNKNSK